MSISTATFSQWFQALELVFKHNGITIENINQDKLRENYYNHNFTVHDAFEDITKGAQYKNAV